MYFAKTSLLLIGTFLIPILGNAELIGGHDKQRLSLIFLDHLSEYVKYHPIAINRSQFPISLADTPENKKKIALFNVLVEEGLLAKAVYSENVGINKVFVAQVITYMRPDDVAEEAILVGRIAIEQITMLTKMPTNEQKQTRYEVQFLWHFEQPAPWIWAPVLSNNGELNRLKNSMVQGNVTSASFVWDEDRWQLDKQPTFSYSKN